MTILATDLISTKAPIGYTGSSIPNWTLKTANYTAVNNDRILANTSGGTFTITLPASPTAGTYIQIADAGNFAVTNLTVARNGATIEGIADNVILDIGNTTYEFMYSSSTWQISATSGAPAVAGGDTQIQYNNNGKFGGSSNFTYNSTTGTVNLLGTDPEVIIGGITNEPGSPASNSMIFYAKNVGGRMLPKFKGPAGIDSPLQPILALNKVSWWSAPGNSTTVPAGIGFNAFTAVGTGTARNVATTNMFTRMRRLGYVSAATAGSGAGHYETVAQYTLGNGAGLGGFYYVVRFGASDAVSQTGARQFVGLTSSVAAPTTVEPATLTNAIGVGAGTADTNLSIYYGGSAAQTPIALGAAFPKSSVSIDMYELILFAPTNVDNTVYYRVTRLNTGAEASGALTAATAGTQLPAPTTFLSHRAWRFTVAAAAVGLDVVSVYTETDY